VVVCTKGISVIGSAVWRQRCVRESVADGVQMARRGGGRRRAISIAVGGDDGAVGRLCSTQTSAMFAYYRCTTIYGE
jgi:hypothetical protein